MTLSPAPAALAAPSRAVVLVGDVRAGLASLEPESVQMVCTSPPYWGLRAYGTNPQVWGGDSLHAHEWCEGIAGNRQPNTSANSTLNNSPAKRNEIDREPQAKPSVCPCGAWLGELGSEPTPELYVEHLVDVFRHVRRVLRPDGVLFVNLGDSYAGSGKGPTGKDGLQNAERRQGFVGKLQDVGPQIHTNGAGRIPSLKPKDLVGMPWRVALALQADGWWWRSTIVWAKKACMPESVSDRPTNAWEPILLFSRSRTYFWDADAVREPSQVAPENAWRYNYGRYDKGGVKRGERTGRPDHLTENDGYLGEPPGGRNLRNVWDLRGGEPVSDFWLLGPSAFPGSHFATFVPEVPRRCILAGTSEKGQCPHCGAPWERVVDTAYVKSPVHGDGSQMRKRLEGTDTNGWAGMPRVARQDTTAGWRPSCACPSHEPVPQTVLDPFGGALTTAMVAARLGRDSVSIELNAQYAEMGAERIRQDAGFMANVDLREVGRDGRG